MARCSTREGKWNPHLPVPDIAGEAYSLRSDFFSCQTAPRVVYCAPQRQKRLSRQPHSVIGNTPDFGSVFLGSSPGGAANPTLLQGGYFVAFFQDSSSPGASLNAIPPSSAQILENPAIVLPRMEHAGVEGNAGKKGIP